MRLATPSLAIFGALLLGCSSPTARGPCRLTVRGYVNSPGEYIIQDPRNARITDIVSLSGGVSSVAELQQYRAVFKRLPIELVNPKPISIKPDRWQVPLKELGVDLIGRYNTVDVNHLWDW